MSLLRHGAGAATDVAATATRGVGADAFTAVRKADMPDGDGDELKKVAEQLSNPDPDDLIPDSRQAGEVEGGGRANDDVVGDVEAPSNRNQNKKKEDDRTETQKTEDATQKTERMAQENEQTKLRLDRWAQKMSFVCNSVPTIGKVACGMAAFVVLEYMGLVYWFQDSVGRVFGRTTDKAIDAAKDTGSKVAGAAGDAGGSVATMFGADFMMQAFMLIMVVSGLVMYMAMPQQAPVQQ